MSRVDARHDYDGPERRLDTNGWGTGLPIWVRAIALVGIPGAIAFFLVYIGAQTIPRMQENLIVQQQQILKMQDLISQHIQQQEALYRLMQRFCANAGRTQDEKDRCYDR